MPYEMFYENGTEQNSLDDLEKLLSNPAIHVLWKVVLEEYENVKHMVYGGVETEKIFRTVFYVFYEDRLEALKQEQQDFIQKLEIVKAVAEDENYIGLKNITQRKLYLLSHYGVVKSEADEIIALLTPEMAAIYKDYVQEVEEDVNPNQGIGFLPTD